MLKKRDMHREFRSIVVGQVPTPEQASLITDVLNQTFPGCEAFYGQTIEPESYTIMIDQTYEPESPASIKPGHAMMRFFVRGIQGILELQALKEGLSEQDKIQQEDSET
jgi:hypothetical protein